MALANALGLQKAAKFHRVVGCSTTFQFWRELPEINVSLIQQNSVF